MTAPRSPNDPFDPNRLIDPIPPADPYVTRPRLEEDLQADPELAEGPASNARIAMFAVGIAIVLGVVFYGLNNSHLGQQNAANKPAPVAQNSNAPALPPAPPGMRDVTPRNNSEPGTTTGSAPANPQPQSPASTAPGGANTNAAGNPSK